MASYCPFQEPWWLDAVALGAWESLEVDPRRVARRAHAHSTAAQGQRRDFTLGSKPGTPCSSERSARTPSRQYKNARFLLGIQEDVSVGELTQTITRADDAFVQIE